MCKREIFKLSNMLTLDDIRYMLDNNCYATEYQPFVSVETGQVIGYEALARFVLRGQNIFPSVVMEKYHSDLKLFY